VQKVIERDRLDGDHGHAGAFANGAGAAIIEEHIVVAVAAAMLVNRSRVALETFRAAGFAPDDAEIFGSGIPLMAGQPWKERRGVGQERYL
jgi:hypothetical protein